eukprot:GEMP01000875.1.p1 GENE.GEMP01000875.1~~GEMP01000875.1.p1  ORF type:complete len:1677 (+),score=289.26 GEMP01000875.1:39-5033(+)
MGNLSLRAQLVFSPTIPYDVAVKRLPVDEFRRYVEGFERLAEQQKGSKKPSMTREVFFSSFLVELLPTLPEELQEILYNGFTDDEAVLTLEDFICGLCLLRHGSPEERLDFLFKALRSPAKKKTRSPHRLSYHRLHQCIEHIQKLSSMADLPDVQHEQTRSVVSELQHVKRLHMEHVRSGQREKLERADMYGFGPDMSLEPVDDISLEEFRRWASENLTHTLVGWIFELQRRLDIPTETPMESMPVGFSSKESLASLVVSKTGLTKEEARLELCVLQKAFHHVQACSKSGVVDRDTLKIKMCPPLETEMVDRVFAVMDLTETGQIDLREFVSALSMLTLGSLDNKIEWLASLFEEDGVVSVASLTQLIRSLWRVDDYYSNTAVPPVGQSLNDSCATLRLSRISDIPNISSSAPALTVEDLVQECVTHSGADPRRDAVTKVEVVAWLHDPNNICAATLLRRLESVLSLSLGVRPNCTSSAREIISEVFQRVLGKSRIELTQPIPADPQASQGDIWMCHNCETRLARSFVKCAKCGSDKPVPGDKYKGQPRYNWQFDPDTAQVGDKWCVVPIDWWNAWLEYSHFIPHNSESSTNREIPPAIDNTPLVSINFVQLKKNLSEDEDYVLIPSDVWTVLASWYDAVELVPGDGGKIMRSVVRDEHGLFLDLYPRSVMCFHCDKKGQAQLNSEQNVLLLFDGDATWKDAHYLATQRLFYSTKTDTPQQQIPTRMWRIKGKVYTLIYGDELMNCIPRSDDNIQIMIETTIGGVYPRGTVVYSPTHFNKSPTAATSYQRVKSETAEKSQKRYGLVNLGNTCYLNSSIQALYSVAPLRQMFLLGEYLYDVQCSNPMGVGGRLAVAYANLLRDMTKMRETVSPHRFKRIMGTYCTAFDGYRQHDAEEFLSVLLDGLHQDVNPLENTEYIEMKDSENRPDNEVSREWWIAHLKRNQSIISFLYDGMHKSSIRCLTCGMVSNRFEPFRHLSLPMPQNKSGNELNSSELTLQFRFFQNRKWPKKWKIPYNQRTTIRDIVLSACSLDEILELDPNHVAVTRFSDTATGSFICKIYDPSMYIAQLSIKERQSLVLYETRATFTKGFTSSSKSSSSSPSPSRNARIHVKLVHRELVRTDAYFLNPTRRNLVKALRPCLLEIEPNCTISDLYAQVWNSVKIYFSDWEPGAATALRRGELVSIKDWGFLLFNVNVDGRSCATCCTFQACPGCPPELPFTGFERHGGFTISCDWPENYINSANFRESAARFVEDDEAHPSSGEKNCSRASLEDLMRNFSEPEEVRMFCSDCTKKNKQYTERKCVKQLSIWAGPPVLVIQLKRFQQNQYGRYEKNDRFIRYPVTNFDVSQFLGLDGTPNWTTGEEELPGPSMLRRGRIIYDLSSVICQSGSLHGGHYTCLAYDGVSKWRSFNDEYVFECASEDSVVTSTAYLLLYTRKDVANLVDVRSVFPRVPDRDPCDANCILPDRTMSISMQRSSRFNLGQDNAESVSIDVMAESSPAMSVRASDASHITRPSPPLVGLPSGAKDADEMSSSNKDANGARWSYHVLCVLSGLCLLILAIVLLVEHLDADDSLPAADVGPKVYIAFLFLFAVLCFLSCPLDHRLECAKHVVPFPRHLRSVIEHATSWVAQKIGGPCYVILLMCIIIGILCAVFIPLKPRWNKA